MNSSKVFWVDPARDFLLVRFTTERAGKLGHQVDIEYAMDDSNGYIPNKWSIMVLNASGGLSFTEEAKLTTYEINPEIKSDLFDLDFPIGSWVTNNREEGKDGKPTEYIIRPNGEKRIILPQERGASYEELLGSASGMLRPLTKRNIAVWVYIGLTAAFGVAISLAFKRKKFAPPQR
jgi:hypothetical protein